MRDAEIDVVLGVLFLLLVAALLGGLVGGCTARECEQIKAVNAGVARWSVNPETGETKFIYGARGR
jgi:hypothetical protein